MTDYILIFIVIAIFCIFALVIFGISSMCKFNHPTPIPADEDDKPKIEGSSTCVADPSTIVRLEYYHGRRPIDNSLMLLVFKLGSISIENRQYHRDINIINNGFIPLRNLNTSTYKDNGLSGYKELSKHSHVANEIYIDHYEKIFSVINALNSENFPMNEYFIFNNAYNAVLEYYFHIFIYRCLMAIIPKIKVSFGIQYYGFVGDEKLLKMIKENSYQNIYSKPDSYYADNSEMYYVVIDQNKILEYEKLFDDLYRTASINACDVRNIFESDFQTSGFLKIDYDNQQYGINIHERIPLKSVSAGLSRKQDGRIVVNYDAYLSIFVNGYALILDPLRGMIRYEILPNVDMYQCLEYLDH